MIPAANIKLKRAYEPVANGDGQRILVDRLWPRGVRKSDLKIQEWLKDIAPTAELRKWFGHDPKRWHEFQRRYRLELQLQPARIAKLRRLARRGPITLVFAAKDETHNDAVALRKILLGRGAPRRRIGHE